MKRVSLADIPEEGVSHNPEIRKQVLLVRGDLPHLTGFSRSRILPGQVARAHRHTGMFEVFFVESGEGRIKVNGLERDLSTGVCIVVEPGESHEITNNSASELVLMYFGVEE